MLRLEFELASGLVLRRHLTKEEYAEFALEEAKEVRVQIRNYRILAAEEVGLPPEQEITRSPCRPPQSIFDAVVVARLILRTLSLAV
jgi:hypothetical protein